MAGKVKSRELFPDVVDRLNHWYYQNWKGTQDQFADKVRSLMPDGQAADSLDGKTVSQWLNGHTPFLKYLQAICKALEVDISEFVISKRADLYRYSKEFTNTIEEDLANIAVNNFDIDLALFKAVRNMIPDFDEKFPVFTPLVFCEYANKPYERRVSAATLAPDENGGLFRVTRSVQANKDTDQVESSTEKQTIFLTKYDFKLIKDLQNNLRECMIPVIYYWFDKVSSELADAEASINLDHAKRNPPGMDFFTDIPDANMDDYLQRFDSWGMYNSKELRKYRLPYRERKDKTAIEITTDINGNEIPKEKGSIDDGEH